MELEEQSWKKLKQLQMWSGKKIFFLNLNKSHLIQQQIRANTRRDQNLSHWKGKKFANQSRSSNIGSDFMKMLFVHYRIHELNQKKF